MAFHWLGWITSILNSKHVLAHNNPLAKPWQQNLGWLVFPQWPLDNSELIFALLIPLCTAFSCITIYFIKIFLLLVDHPVLIPGYTTNFRVFPKSYQQYFFFRFTHKNPDKCSHGSYCYVSLPEKPLFSNPPLTMAFGELSAWDGSYKVHCLLHAHNSQWSQWKLSSSAWSSGQCQRNILTILLDIKNTLLNSVTWS